VFLLTDEIPSVETFTDKKQIRNEVEANLVVLVNSVPITGDFNFLFRSPRHL
jgi:hypothetical protein